MNNLNINTNSKTYPIYFTQSFDGFVEAIESINKSYSSYIIVTDSNVGPLYEEIVSSQLKTLNKPVYISRFEAGEKNKNLDTISKFYEDLVSFNADRKSLVVALGGGVTGDMAGFLSATYMRGIDFVQVPTSLLSQVDSSVGGKTGVDFNGYKNLVGAFYQPEFVYINVSTLDTLPKRELYAGMSEVVKHGFIKDLSYIEFLEENVEEVLLLNEDVLITMIKRSCEIKKSVVDEDEKEQGVRALLNFGHTFGHSIERIKGFELIHGECVAIGMHGAFLLSEALGLLSSSEVVRAINLLKAYHMPLTVKNIDKSKVYSDMFHDKKTANKRLVFALLNTFGDSFLSTDTINQELIEQCLDQIIINE